MARDNVTDAELALDKDGTFLAFRVSSFVNAGAYLQSGFQAYTGNLGTLAGVYRTPAMYVESTAVFTHTHPCRPYRGNGRPEAAYVIERMVDVAAAQLKMDPAELRRKNYIPPEAMPFKTSLTFTYDSGEFEKGMDLALKLADLEGFAKRKAESKKRGKLRGLGMSNTIERAAAPSLEGAEIRFDRGGTVQMFSGSHQPGPGPRDHVQAGGGRQARHPSERHRVHPGRHRQGVLRRRHRRLALGHHVGLGVPHGRRKGHRQGQGDRRAQLSRSMSPT